MRSSLVLLFILSSCGSVHQTKNTNFNKVSFLNKQEIKVEYYFEKEIDIPSYRASRTIASVDTDSESNKEIYFKALWKQTKTIGDHLGKSHINSCPAFHQVVLTQDQSTHRLGNMSFEQNNPVLFPYLALKREGKTLDTESNIEEVSREYLSFHHDKMKKELDTLCNTGVSENFFIFENTISYFSKMDTTKTSKEILNSYLKIPVFANLYLLDSLRAPQFSVYNSERAVLSKLHAKWFENYLYNLRERRKNRISMR